MTFRVINSKMKVKKEGYKKMEYMGTKEASERWGYSQNTISRWCRFGLIEKAEQDKKGSPWRIPINENCPRKVKNTKKEI